MRHGGQDVVDYIQSVAPVEDLVINLHYSSVFRSNPIDAEATARGHETILKNSLVGQLVLWIHRSYPVYRKRARVPFIYKLKIPFALFNSNIPKLL